MVLNDTLLRRLVGAALLMLLAHQAGAAVAGLASVAAGGATALLVAVVTLLSAQRAHAGFASKVWLLLPVALFVVLPLVLRIWKLFSAETGWIDWLVGLAPMFFGFLLPVLLLWLVYAELHKRTAVKPAPDPTLPPA